MVVRYTLTHYEEEFPDPAGEHVRFADFAPLLDELAELRAIMAELKCGKVIFVPGTLAIDTVPVVDPAFTLVLS